MLIENRNPLKSGLTNVGKCLSYRNRVIYGLLTAGVMIAGFLSRRLLGHYAFIKLYVGDALWAMMVFFGFAFLFRSWPTWKVAAAALGFSICIEVSQLYHAQWIDAIRNMPLGGLILGYTFVWSDLLCYSVGVGIGVMLDVFLIGTVKNATKF